MKTQHTPGPWSIGRTVIGEKAIYRKNEEDGKTITETYICKMMLLVPNPANYDEYDANTTLIAAAPELLLALEKLVAYTTNNEWRRYAEPNSIEAIRNGIAAIKKAKGE